MESGLPQMPQKKGGMSLYDLRSLVVAGLLAPTLLGSALVPAPALARGFFAGNSVYANCQASGNTLSWGLCRGYIIGALDAYEAETEALHLKPAFCIPEGVTVEQAADVAVQYMQEHPENRHTNAASLVWISVFQAFPCNRPGGT